MRDPRQAGPAPRPGFEPDFPSATPAPGPVPQVGSDAQVISTPPPQPALPPAVTAAAAAVLMIFFLWMTIQMFGPRINAGDAIWARSLSIYVGIEAFALAAAGVLLGTTIQAGRVRSAEGRADRKEEETNRAKAGQAAAEQNRAALRQALEGTRATLGDGGGDRASEPAALHSPEGDAAARMAAARRQIDSVLNR